MSENMNAVDGKSIEKTKNSVLMGRGKLRARVIKNNMKLFLKLSKII